MEKRLILLFVFMGIILLGIIGAIVIAFIFSIRKRTIVHIVHPNNYITKHKFNGAMEKSFTIDKRTYIYDNSCEFRKGFRHYIYYFYNKTYPLVFDKASMTISAGEYNTTEVKSVLKTDLVNKLLSTLKELDLLRIALIVLGVIALINLVLLIIMFVSPENLATPENALFIKEQVRLAVSGA